MKELKTCGNCRHFRTSAPESVLFQISKASQNAIRTQTYCVVGRRPKKAGIKDPACYKYEDYQQNYFWFWFACAASGILAVISILWSGK